MFSSGTITRNKSKCETGEIFSKCNLHYILLSLCLIATITSGKHVEFGLFTLIFMHDYFISLILVCVNAYKVLNKMYYSV